MTESELKQYLIINYPIEDEKIEWKAWTGNFNIDGKSKDDLGSYVSAVSNENGGFLIIGVENITLNILGISLNKRLREVELEILRKTSPQIKISINELETSDTLKKIWIVKIPKHPTGEWVTFNQPYQRSRDSLIELTQSRKDEIRLELFQNKDWSKEICHGATINDLDTQAVEKARVGYIEKNYKDNETRANEVRNYTVETFLSEAKLNINGLIRKATVLLLGIDKSVHYLDTMAEIL